VTRITNFTNAREATSDLRIASAQENAGDSNHHLQSHGFLLSRPLRDSATPPSPEPVYAEKDILTGVDALGAANRWKMTARCNAGKLNAIGSVQP